LKPENVLFSASGAPLIADLGIAKHFDREAKGASLSVALSRAEGFRGTAGYMAPEQSMDARSVGPPADVFALGAVLHECLAGTPAFVGDTVLELLARVGSGNRESLAKLRPDAPRWLVAVLDRALATAPGDRFADGAALADALARRESRTAARRPTLVAAAVIVALAAASFLALRPAPEAPPVPSPPRRPVEPPRSSVPADAVRSAATSVAALASALEPFAIDTEAMRATAENAARALERVAALPAPDLATVLAPLDARIRLLLASSTTSNDAALLRMNDAIVKALAPIATRKRTPLLAVARHFFGPVPADLDAARAASEELRAYAEGTKDALLAGLAYDRAADFIFRALSADPELAARAIDLFERSAKLLEASGEHDVLRHRARHRFERLRDLHHFLAIVPGRREEHARAAAAAARDAADAEGADGSTVRASFACLLEIAPLGKEIEDFLAAHRSTLEKDIRYVEYVRVHEGNPARALELATSWGPANADLRLDLLAVRTLALLDLHRVAEARALLGELGKRDHRWPPCLTYFDPEELERRVVAAEKG
ncbi:MAG TPA: hypothetical protein VFF73_42365, partial [Planctomycetota bacterium]|nr:hypothetical protein [Planctomycetota bacterium]